MRESPPNMPENLFQKAAAMPPASAGLFNAIAHKDPLTVKALLDAKVNIETRNPDGRTALLLATRYGFTEIVEILLKADPKPQLEDQNEYGRTPLLEAIVQKKSALCKILLQAGADFTMKISHSLGNSSPLT